MDQAPDLAGADEQVPEPRDDVLVVAGVAVENGRRVAQDIVERERQLATDRLDRGGRRAELLGLEQLQSVQRRGDVPRVDLEELAVAVVEGLGLAVLDVERADDRAVVNQGDRQRAARAAAPSR